MADVSIPLISVTTLSNPPVDPTPRTPFTTIDAFLRSSTSNVDDTVRELLRDLNNSRCLQEPWNSLDNAENIVTMIFGEIWFIASQIPCKHPWHQRLASLIKTIGKQPPPPKAVCVAYGDEDFRWDLFPRFGAIEAENFDYKHRLGGSMDYDMWSPQEWLSINTFLAVLVAEDFGRHAVQFAGSGFSVLANTLDFPRDIAALEDNIPSAAMWILTAGKWFSEHLGLHLGPAYIHGGTAASDFRGPVGLCDERWRFWAKKFRELAGRSDLSEEARDWASQAAEYMSESY